MAWRQQECACETVLGSRIGGRLLHGDARDGLFQNMTGSVQCIYMDPPFCTGGRFFMRLRVGESGWRTGSPSIMLNAYNDRFNSRDDYLNYIRPVLQNAWEMLSDTGVLFLHADSRMSPYLRVELDRLFGDKNFVNEIIWAYQTGGRTMHSFSSKHDTILFYAKNIRHMFFDITQAPLTRGEHRSNHMRRHVDDQGRTYRSIKSGGKTYVYYDDAPVYPSDVWDDVSHLQQKDPQRTGYDTQKPFALLQRIINCTTHPGDLVCDPFCGSGTTLAVAADAGRRFLGVDSSPVAISVARKRLLNTQLTIRGECTGRLAHVNAHLHCGIGYYEIVLDEAILDDEALASPALSGMTLGALDAVDQWSVGFMADGVFQTHKSAFRAKYTPELPHMLELPMLRGAPAVMLCDIMGGRSVWQMDEATLTHALNTASQA